MTPTPDPQPGDIGCTQITGNVGLLIRLGQWLNGDGFANYEHAFVYLGRGQIIEAEPGGARVTDLAEYDARTIAWIHCPSTYAGSVADAARQFEHVPYGFADYLAIALHRFHIPVPGLKAFANSTRTLICSQLAVQAARRGGWDLLADTPAGYVTPDDLATLALATPDSTVTHP